MSVRPRRAMVNHDLLNATGVDSGALTILGALIRRFPEPGEYLGVAERGKNQKRFHLTVDPSVPARQVNVNLASLPESGEERFAVNPEGHVVFHITHGSGGYAVRVAAAAKGLEPVFDSCTLDGDDMFAVTLVRPGTYSLRNLTAGAEGEIEVGYPERGKGKGGPGDPVQIVCTAEAFDPHRIMIGPTQGQVFRFRTPSRIAIELVEPNDGPHPRRRRG